MTTDPHKLAASLPDCDDCELPMDICACEDAAEYDAANPLVRAVLIEEVGR